MGKFVFSAFVCLLLCGVLPSLRAENQPAKEDDNGYAQIAIFAKALELIRQDYVDGNKTELSRSDHRRDEGDA